MLSHELHSDDGILVIRPEGPLRSEDFEELAAQVDEYIVAYGSLTGVMIDAEHFPGWEDFGALVSHLKFVRDNHNDVGKIAAVTDSRFLSIVPQIVDHFVSAEVRHFEHADRNKAMDWLRKELAD